MLSHVVVNNLSRVRLAFGLVISWLTLGVISSIVNSGHRGSIATTAPLLIDCARGRGSRARITFC